MFLALPTHARSTQLPRASPWQIALGNVSDIARAIRTKHDCDCRYAGWVRIRDDRGNFGGEELVHIFNLLNCADGERCYAWTPAGQRELILVLNSFVVTSAQSAVHYALR